ncbi:phage tail protein [Pantoea septica]|uniref:phage tail protein n=1 Tax=Pantoea septica TaxID=472695 RepID=UPI0023F2519A|nr:phage tail protein [Pantoea septica]
MTTKYYALLTNQGAARLANATALGTKLQITEMAVGDGGGALPTPDASQTKLIGEKRRAALNSLSVDAANSSQIIAEQIIPENEGGFWIREIGLFDADGVMIAVANCAETYKPQLQEGSGRTQTVRMIIIVNSVASVTLKIDPSVVLATRKYVDDGVIEVKAYADDLMAKHNAAADPHKQYAPKENPIFTGAPKAPTPVTGNSSTLIATTAFVQAAIAQLVASSPAALDTLNELAAALGNDPNFATTIANQLGQKANISGNSNNNFFVRNSGDPTAAVNNQRLDYMLGNYAYKGGDVNQGLAVAAGTTANSAVAYGQFQSGSNGNGAWIKLPGGGMWCRANFTVAANSSFTWTFPMAFYTTPGLYASTLNGAPNVWFSGAASNAATLYNGNGAAVNVNFLAIL